ncbi:MAG: phosphonoacetaldehyde reductase [Verrucomicrobiae bacterium]|nr:phosphonoacetaldehyde reductase [Verrucomicrobiae bacterium]NNJ42515.1 phosphonoacetaldehyde reductase [Akkermansiaceae bacterium]
MSHQISAIGKAAWAELFRFINERNASRILVVTGRSCYSMSGAADSLKPILENREVTFVTEFEQNPKAEDVVRILAGLGSPADYDVILAVGGGSVMDVAKLIKGYWESPLPVYGNLQRGEELNPCDIPLVAIPTTAGSGSEATHFAVVYLGKEKFSVAHNNLLPDLAVIVPSLLTSLPRHIAAASGMDALCQGIESYWSIFSTDESQRMAGEAISLAWRSLEKSVLDKEPTAIEEIARASHLAGKAINLTKTTAPHAVSYALTSFYGLQHGHAVALLVPEFLKYNAAVTSDDCLDHRGVEWVHRQLMEISQKLGCFSIMSAANALKEMMKNIGLETSFNKLGIKSEEDIDQLVKNGFNPQRVNNNPRLVTKRALEDLLKSSN